MTLYASQSLHPVLKLIKQNNNSKTRCSELGKKHGCVGSSHHFQGDPCQQRISLIPLAIFALHIYSESNFCRSCVSTGLLPHVSIPRVISLQSSKIVRAYWIALRELPSDSIISCPPCWTVIFLSVVKEFWVYSVPSCFMKEDTACGGWGWGFAKEHKTKGSFTHKSACTSRAFLRWCPMVFLLS